MSVENVYQSLGVPVIGEITLPRASVDRVAHKLSYRGPAARVFYDFNTDEPIERALPRIIPGKSVFNIRLLNTGAKSQRVIGGFLARVVDVTGYHIIDSGDIELMFTYEELSLGNMPAPSDAPVPALEIQPSRLFCENGTLVLLYEGDLEQISHYADTHMARFSYGTTLYHRQYQRIVSKRLDGMAIDVPYVPVALAVVATDRPLGDKTAMQIAAAHAAIYFGLDIGQSLAQTEVMAET